MAKFICRVHGENFTVDIPCDSEVIAELEAYEIMSQGVRDGNKFYPNRFIVHCELIRKEE